MRWKDVLRDDSEEEIDDSEEEDEESRHARMLQQLSELEQGRPKPWPPSDFRRSIDPRVQGVHTKP